MLGVFLFSLITFLLFPVYGCYSQGPGQQEVQKQRQKYNYADQEAYDTWDFGEVKEGEVIKHNFTLKNETDKVLNIEHVHTSCGCTASEVKKKILKPQEATTIEVTLKSKGYSGLIKQYVYVHTDSLDNPVIKFTIKANVVKKGVE